MIDLGPALGRPEVVGGGFALLGVGLGAWLQHRRTLASQREERTWELYTLEVGRLERIFLTLRQVRQGFESTAAGTATALATGASFDRKPSERLDWSTLDMLCGLHAPYLVQECKMLRELGDAVSLNAVNTVRAASAGSAERNSLMERVKADWGAFDAKASAIEACLLKRGRSLWAAATEKHPASLSRALKSLPPSPGA